MFANLIFLLNSLTIRSPLHDASPLSNPQHHLVSIYDPRIPPPQPYELYVPIRYTLVPVDYYNQYYNGQTPYYHYVSDYPIHASQHVQYHNMDHLMAAPLTPQSRLLEESTFSGQEPKEMYNVNQELKDESVNRNMESSQDPEYLMAKLSLEDPEQENIAIAQKTNPKDTHLQDPASDENHSRTEVLIYQTPEYNDIIKKLHEVARASSTVAKNPNSEISFGIRIRKTEAFILMCILKKLKANKDINAPNGVICCNKHTRPRTKNSISQKNCRSFGEILKSISLKDKLNLKKLLPIEDIIDVNYWIMKEDE